MKTLVWSLKRFANLEMMNSGDELFFLDDYRQTANVVCWQKTEKFKTVDFRRAQFEKAMNFERMRSRVVTFLGR